jgi:hypothetical protein
MHALAVAKDEGDALLPDELTGYAARSAAEKRRREKGTVTFLQKPKKGDSPLS